MNFLAHAYLSFNHPQILVGNMISDFLKGSARFGFSGNIQSGIILHRNIDEFTDNHPATKKAKEFFRPAYRLYSGAIMDIIYDYFLANDKESFSLTSLAAFSRSTYQVLEAHSSMLPNRFLYFFSYMKAQDWLFNYHTKQGIGNSLAGLVRRSSFLSESETAFRIFIDHENDLELCYKEFFPDVKHFANQRMKELVR